MNSLVQFMFLNYLTSMLDSLDIFSNLLSRSNTGRPNSRFVWNWDIIFYTLHMAKLNSVEILISVRKLEGFHGGLTSHIKHTFIRATLVYHKISVNDKENLCSRKKTLKKTLPWKKSVFYQTLWKKICMLPNFKGKKYVLYVYEWQVCTPPHYP